MVATFLALQQVDGAALLGHCSAQLLLQGGGPDFLSLEQLAQVPLVMLLGWII